MRKGLKKMAKSFETTVEIKGAIGSSFTEAFRKASGGLGDLRKEARAVQQEMDRLGRDFREGKIHQSQYTEETQKLIKELEKLERAQKRQQSLDNSVSAVQTRAGNVWNNTKAFAAVGAVTATTAASAAFVDSIKTAADFEAQMARVGAIAGASTSQMDQLSASAVKLGASTSKSATEVAKGMENMAAMGFSANEILGAMPGVISAAEASGADMAQTADVVSSSLNIFGLKASEATRVADILAQTANQSAADITDMQYALKYAGPPADSLGMSLEETSAAIGIMTNAGMEGEQAGTTLRGALLGLLDPSEENSKMMSKMGIQITDSKKNFVGLSKLIKNLSKSMEGQTDTQKAATLSALVGKEAVSGMLSLMKAGPSTIDKMTKSLENSAGASAEAAKKMKDNFAGAKEQMFGAIESAQIAFATPILPVLQDTFNGLSNIIEKNMGSIEAAGKATAAVLEDIFAPFSMKKPEIEFVKKTDPTTIISEQQDALDKYSLTTNVESFMNPDKDTLAMQKYQQELAQYEMFQGMDMSEKVEYMLNEATDTMDTWLKGEGGEVMDSIFTELGTIAGKAWLNSFTTATTGAVENLAEGNFSGALGLGIMANMMTGGLLLSGGLAGGKWALGKGKEIYANKKSNKASAEKVGTKESTGDTKKASSGKAKTAVATDAETALTRSAKNAAKKGSFAKGLSKFSKLGKFAGKAFLPLSLLGYGANIIASDNKAKAIGGTAGGLSGGLAGAALGASVGSVIPIVGTAAGGLIGGIAGGMGGDWLGSKMGQWFGSNKASASSPDTSSSAAIDMSKLNQSAATAIQSMDILTSYLGQASGWVVGAYHPMQPAGELVTTNLGHLTMYTGQASGWVVGAFYPMQENGNTVNQNLSILSSYVGQASGWVVGGLYGIQSAGQRVIAALDSLTERINNTPVPGSNRRVGYDG